MDPSSRMSVPPRKRRGSRWLWLVGLLVVAAIAYSYTQGKPGAKDAAGGRPQASVVLGTASRRDVPHYLTGLGTVQAYNTVTVRARVDGQLQEILFQEGQQVKAGDVLAKIDPRTFQAAYDQAVATKRKNAASLANARLDVKRYEQLGDSIARQTLETQQATVRQLVAQVAADQAAIDSAAAQLSYTTITAPISGRTGMRQIDVGNMIHASDTGGLVVITQVQPIAVMFSLPQQQLGTIVEHMNQQTLTVDALAADGSTVLDRGTLLLVDNTVNQTTGTAKLKAVFPNANAALWPGTFVTARLLLKTEAQALAVPAVAVQQGPQGPYVFVYQPDGTVRMQTVSVGMNEGEDAIITAGLAEGAQVVIDGMAKLRDQSKVVVAKPEHQAEDSNTEHDSRPEGK